MDHNIVKLFRQKLDNMSASDYYGFKSPGFTCYLNSILQVLFMTPQFREAVKSVPNPSRRGEESTSIDPDLEKLFADLAIGTADTRPITELLQIKDLYEQQDAAEYFQKILSLCSSEAAKIFKGQLNYKVTCCRCKQENNSKNHFWILPLAVEHSHHEIYSVSKGFEKFFKSEKVSGENKMYCRQCCENKDTTVQCQITQYPEVLTLLLKRFSFDVETNRYVKLHCEADVCETLQTQHFRYELYAVVTHTGSLTGGHYTTLIKSFENGEWYHFNDIRVHRVEHFLSRPGNTCRRSRVYLLMYKRVRKDVPEAPVPSSGSIAERCDPAERRAAPVCHNQQTANRRKQETHRVLQTQKATGLADNSQRNIQGRPEGTVARLLSDNAKPREDTDDTLQKNHNAGRMRQMPKDDQRAAKGTDGTKSATSNRALKIEKIRQEGEALVTGQQQSHKMHNKNCTLNATKAVGKLPEARVREREAAKERGKPWK